MKAQRTAIFCLVLALGCSLTVCALANDRVRPAGSEVDLTDSEVHYPTLLDESKRLIYRPLYYQEAALAHVVDSVVNFRSLEDLPLDWDIQMIDGIANGAAIDPYLDGVWTYSSNSILFSQIAFAGLFVGTILGAAAGLAFATAARRDLPIA